MPVVSSAPWPVFRKERRWRGAVVSGAVLALALSLVQPAQARDAAQRCDAASLALLGAAAGAEPVAAACRDWPYDPAIRLVAAAWPDVGADGSDDDPLLLVSAMLDPAGGRVLARHERPLEQDAAFALREGGIRLDTARYDLAPGVRAFGVVLTSSARGPSCPDRGFERELTLLVRDGQALRPVFATWLDTWEMVEGSPCSWSPQRSVSDHAQVTLGVERTSSHGFADLTLTASVERHASDEDGALQVETRRARRTLRYDGNAYATDPFDNLFFWSSNPW